MRFPCLWIWFYEDRNCYCCRDPKKHIQTVESKGSGHLADIGTCSEFQQTCRPRYVISLILTQQAIWEWTHRANTCMIFQITIEQLFPKRVIEPNNQVLLPEPVLEDFIGRSSVLSSSGPLSSAMDISPLTQMHALLFFRYFSSFGC